MNIFKLQTGYNPPLFTQKWIIQEFFNKELGRKQKKIGFLDKKLQISSKQQVFGLLNMMAAFLTSLIT